MFDQDCRKNIKGDIEDPAHIQIERPNEPLHLLKRILDDLAGCAYAVVNGGHNLLSEAFYYGKPALCFPVKTLFEQFINAYHVRALGYGDYSDTAFPSPALFDAFEARLDGYRAAVAAGFREGTAEIVARMRELIADPSKIA